MKLLHISIAANDQDHIVATLKTKEEGLIGRGDLTEIYGYKNEGESVVLKAMRATLHRSEASILKSAREYSGEPTALIALSS